MPPQRPINIGISRLRTHRYFDLFACGQILKDKNKTWIPIDR